MNNDMYKVQEKELLKHLRTLAAKGKYRIAIKKHDAVSSTYSIRGTNYVFELIITPKFFGISINYLSQGKERIIMHIPDTDLYPIDRPEYKQFAISTINDVLIPHMVNLQGGHIRINKKYVYMCKGDKIYRQRIKGLIFPKEVSNSDQGYLDAEVLQ